MAKATLKMPEDFLMKLSRLGEKTDEIIPRVLKAGGEVVEAKVKSNLQSVIGKGTKEESRSTGELASALGVSSARQDKDGNFNVKVGFSEPRQGGKSNAMIAGATAGVTAGDRFRAWNEIQVNAARAASASPAPATTPVR